MTFYPPRHLTTERQVSGSTLRRWSDTFARHLSPSATVAPRRYTEQDVAVMRRIAALSDSGMRIAEIDAILDQAEPQPPTEPTAPPTEPPTTALQTFTTLTDTLHAQQVTQSQIATTLAGLADIAELRAELGRLRERVARLEGAAHTHTGLVRGKPL
jgi:DNA-binding transcriptional MerR regulator